MADVSVMRVPRVTRNHLEELAAARFVTPLAALCLIVGDAYKAHDATRTEAQRAQALANEAARLAKAKADKAAKPSKPVGRPALPTDPLERLAAQGPRPLPPWRPLTDIELAGLGCKPDERLWDREAIILARMTREQAAEWEDLVDAGKCTNLEPGWQNHLPDFESEPDENDPLNWTE